MSTHPTIAARSRESEAQPQPLVPGEAGLWVFIFGDLTVFAVLFGVYLSERSRQPELFVSAQGALDRNIGVINTILLLTSSLLVALATYGTRTAARKDAPQLLGGAMALGLGFVVLKAFEYQNLVAGGATPQTNDFFMYYFALTGLHLAHLLIGLGLLGATLLIFRRRTRTRGHATFIECAACLWHMVDLLWLVIFPLIFLVK